MPSMESFGGEATASFDFVDIGVYGYVVESKFALTMTDIRL